MDERKRVKLEHVTVSPSTYGGNADADAAHGRLTHGERLCINNLSCASQAQSGDIGTRINLERRHQEREPFLRSKILDFDEHFCWESMQPMKPWNTSTIYRVWLGLSLSRLHRGVVIQTPIPATRSNNILISNH